MIPSVTVIMAVYNGQRYLARAVLSILEQTMRDFEFIVVDDGSTDSTCDILSELAYSDPRMITIRNDRNRGLSTSLNRALCAATAPLIAVMDSDDVALPTRLERQIELMRLSPDVVLTGTQVRVIDPYGFTILPTTHLPIRDGDIYNCLFSGGWPLVHPTVMYRTEAAKSCGGYDPDFPVHLDHDLFLKLGEVGALANLPGSYLQYRCHPGGLTWRKGSSREIASAINNARSRRRPARCTPDAPSDQCSQSEITQVLGSMHVRLRFLCWALLDVLLGRNQAWHKFTFLLEDVLRQAEQKLKRGIHRLTGHAR